MAGEGVISSLGAASTQYGYEVIVPDELDSGLVKVWRHFQQVNPAYRNPFLSPDFAMLFGRHRDDARICVVTGPEGVVGFMPYCEGRLGTATALGLGVSDAQGLVLGDCEIDLKVVLGELQLSVFEFDHLVLPSAVHDDAQVGGRVVLHPSPFVDTDGTWEDWLERKTKESKRITTARQKQRKLEREHGELRFDPDCRDADVLNVLMDWKSAQYRRTSRSDRFAQAWLRQLVIDCFESRNEFFESRLSVLYAGDQIVNIDLSLLANGVLAGWFPAYNQELSRYSPGFVAMLEMVRSAMSDPNISVLDMGKGGAPYKETLKTGDFWVGEGWIESPSWKSTLWRTRTEPKRRVMSLVLGNPKLRVAARETLNRIGEVRTRIDRR